MNRIIPIEQQKEIDYNNALAELHNAVTKYIEIDEKCRLYSTNTSYQMQRIKLKKKLIQVNKHVYNILNKSNLFSQNVETNNGNSDKK